MSGQTDHMAEAREFLGGVKQAAERDSESAWLTLVAANTHATLAVAEELRALREQGIRLAAFTPDEASSGSTWTTGGQGHA